MGSDPMEEAENQVLDNKEVMVMLVRNGPPG